MSHCTVSHTPRSVTPQDQSHPKVSHTPRSVIPRGQSHCKISHSPITFQVSRIPRSLSFLPPPQLWLHTPPARARGEAVGYGGDMLAPGSNLSPEDETKATHQGHLGQGLEGPRGSGGAE